MTSGTLQPLYVAHSAAPARHTHSTQVHQPVAMVRLTLPLPGAIRLVHKAVRVSCRLGGRRLGEQGMAGCVAESQHRQPLGAWRTSRLLDSTHNFNRTPSPCQSSVQYRTAYRSGHGYTKGSPRTSTVKEDCHMASSTALRGCGNIKIIDCVAVLACHAIICKVVYPSAFSAPIPRLATSQPN